MKRNLSLLALALAAALPLVAAPLSETTAVLTKPEAGSPILTYLKAGTEPAVPSDNAAMAPAGWLAVLVPGPIEGYVQQKDLSKGLEVKEGVSILMAPKVDAQVLEVATKGEKTTITGIHGRWTQVRLEHPVTGYAYLGASALPIPNPTPATADMPMQPLTPAAVSTPPSTVPGMAAADQSASALPRFFQGKFISTRHAFMPRRPFDWALADASGTRFAYLDVNGLLLTEQIDKYVGHDVVVFGGASAVAGTKDIVIHIESLQLR